MFINSNKMVKRFIIQKILILIIISLFITSNCEAELIKLSSTEDCKTPFECYLKAVETLKTDRAEMRRQIDSLSNQYKEDLQNYENKLKETTVKYEELLNNSKAECNNQINILNQNLQNLQNNINQRVTDVYNSIPRNLALTGTHQGGSYSGCPAGYIAVSCSCGSGCGSWDIQNGNTCHCSCGEWTSAFCLKLQ